MRTSLLCLFWVGLIAFLASGCSAAHGIKPSKNEMESLVLTLQGLNLGASTKYVAAFHDLDGNGSVDAIVYLVGPSVCGSGGCNTIVLSYNHGWSKVSTIHLTRPPIMILDKKYHGWHSISVNVSGGGILHPYSAELNFDGRSFPSNPTMPPAIRINEPKGDIAISSLRGARNIYSH